MTTTTEPLRDAAAPRRRGRRRIKDSSQRRAMLADLKFAFEQPRIVMRCMEKEPNATGLYGFGRWLRDRRCKVCSRRLPVHAEKYCGRTCRGRASRRRNRKGPWHEFMAATVSGKRVVVPKNPAAQAKAGELIERGCCAYVNRDGVICDIGVPIGPGQRGKVFSREASA